MESQSYQLPPEENDAGANIGGGANGGASKSSFLCRQVSSRWIPTTDQIRILRDLYYNCGVRSPTADQIQRISARLRQYGKIEGKNVFYWFQNHKARERQKKMLTVDIASNKYNSGMLSPGVSPACTSPAGVYCVGQVGANGCGGSLLLERNYMDYSRSLPAAGLSGGSMMEGNVGWVAVEPAAMSTPPLCNYHQQRPPCFYEQHQQHPNYEQQQGGGEAVSPPQMETLPLFPVHSEPQRGEEEEDYVDGRSHVNSQLEYWSAAGKANPPHNGHLPATFYVDHQLQQHQLRRQEEEDLHQRQYCKAYDDDSSINIGGASLELSLYSYGPGLPRGPT